MTRGLILSMLASMLAMLTLAACGDGVSEGRGETVQLAANGTPIPDASPSPATPRAEIYLSSFAGRWGVTSADCDISRGDTGGVLDLRGDVLTLNASSGRIGSVAAARPETIAVDVAMKEGQRRWRARMKLALLLGGTRLERTGPGTERVVYTRC